MNQFCKKYTGELNSDASYILRFFICIFFALCLVTLHWRVITRKENNRCVAFAMFGHVTMHTTCDKKK